VCAGELEPLEVLALAIPAACYFPDESTNIKCGGVLRTVSTKVHVMPKIERL